MSRVFLTAEWRMLAMLNYSVDPDLLRPLVPKGTELDDWNGIHFVSLVGFRFLDTRLLGVPIPFHRHFEEVNLRFYVRRGERRGVVFIREIVPRRAIAAVARLVYNEPYVALPMSHSIVPLRDDGKKVEYRWRGDCRLSVTTTGEAAVPAQDSEPQFITEHYWGYCGQRDGGTLKYEVMHPSWLVWQTSEGRFEGDVTGLYGRSFATVLGRSPNSAFLAEGSEIAVHCAKRII